MNRQRGWVSLVMYALLAAAAVAAAWALWWKVDHWCNAACTDLQAVVARLEGEKKAAQERASAIAVMWADGLNKVEVRYVEVERAVRNTFAGLRDRTRGVSADSSGGIRLGSRAVELLDDAHRAANAGDPSAPQVDHRPAEAVPVAPSDETSSATGDVILTPEAFAALYVDAAEAYRDAYEKWKAAVAAYEELRIANESPTH